MPKESSSGFSKALKRVLGKGKRSNRDEAEEEQYDDVQAAAQRTVQTNPLTEPTSQSADHDNDATSSTPSASQVAQQTNAGQTSNTTKHRYGLISLWQDEASESTVDIVAVHGLNGHPFDTWTAEQSSHLWLKDFLPQAIPSARILTFGYNADVYSSRSDNNILSCAKNLLAGLTTLRANGAEHRSLVFVGHSMGGLVIKTALLEAKERNDPVWSATRNGGIMFMAVPHGGSTLAEFSQTLSNIAKVAAPTNNAMLRELEAGSSGLLDLARRFSNIQRDLRFVSVLESERTPLPKTNRGSVKVVEDKSARLNLGEAEYKIDGADHRTVCKFADITDPQYLQVQHSLQTLAQSMGTAAPVPDYLFDFLGDICDRDPYYDMTRIKESKGGLLKDCYRWALNDPELKSWDKDDSRLLWIKGRPGKGKTMLMIGLVETMTAGMTKGDKSVLSYFFCQNDDPRLSNGLFVLRGLIWKILHKHPFLHDHIPALYRSKAKSEGKQIFQGENAFYILTGMLSDMLQDSRLGRVHLFIDALDECDQDLMERILQWIVKDISSRRSKAKWVLSSRYDSWIVEILGHEGIGHNLVLEMNDDHVSKAVQHFINFQVSVLAKKKRYSLELQEEVKAILSKKSESTFLWVALVCQQLRSGNVARRHIISEIQRIPSGLEGLYLRMLESINQAHDEDKECCREILKVTTTTLRPLMIRELGLLAGLWGRNLNTDDVRDLIQLCGSFLLLQHDTVYFVHLSAREFLAGQLPKDHWLAPSENGQEHSTIVARSLRAMSVTLRKNIFGLKNPGHSITEIRDPILDPLAAIRYSCVYWVDHICEIKGVSDKTQLLNGQVWVFLEKHFLHWLEALSLMRQISIAIRALQKLGTLLPAIPDMQNVHLLVRDAKEFALYHRTIIEIAPLQIYASALIFTPVRNRVKELGSEDRPAWIQRAPQVPDWSILQALDGHTCAVDSLQYSHNGQQLASIDMDGDIRIWNAETGECQQILQPSRLKSYSVRVAFSYDDRLVSALHDGPVQIWNTRTGELLRTLRMPDLYRPNGVPFLAFSHDGRLFAATGKQTQIWDANRGIRLKIIHGPPFAIFPRNSPYPKPEIHAEPVLREHANEPNEVYLETCRELCDLGPAFENCCTHAKTRYSMDGQNLVTGDNKGGYGIYDPVTKKLKYDLRRDLHEANIMAARITLDSRTLAISTTRDEIHIFDMKTKTLKKTLKQRLVRPIAFAPDGRRLASGDSYGVIQIWNMEHINSMQQHSHVPDDNQMCLSLDERHLYVVNDMHAEVMATDLSTHKNECVIKLDGDFRAILGNGRILTASYTEQWPLSGTLYHLWDLETRMSLVDGFKPGCLGAVAELSRDGRLVASATKRLVTIERLNPEQSHQVSALRDCGSRIISMAFSYNSKRIVVGYHDKTVRVWSVETGTLELTITAHMAVVESVSFSPSGQRLALGCRDKLNGNGCEIWITDADSGIPAEVLSTGLYEIKRLSFDDDDFSIVTDLGCIELSPDSTATEQQLSAQKPTWKGFNLEKEKAWITWNGIRILAIPAEYRPDYHDGFLYQVQYRHELYVE